MMKSSKQSRQFALAFVALASAVYEGINSAINTLSQNGSGKLIFTQTLRWAGWKATDEAIDVGNDVFLATVPASIRAAVAEQIGRVEAYFDTPKYNGVPLATLCINVLGNSIRVYAGLGTEAQIAAFSYGDDEDISGQLVGIRNTLNALGPYGQCFRMMTGAEPQAMHRFLTSTVEEPAKLQAHLHHYLSEGHTAAPSWFKESDETIAPLHGLDAPASLSVVPSIRSQQASGLGLSASA